MAGGARWVLRVLMVLVAGYFLWSLATGGLGPSREPRPLLVFGAASLQDVLADLADAWRADGGGTLLFSFAGSATLARQIEQGAPADVFISADRAWMDALQADGLVAADTRFDLAGNALVVVAPASPVTPVVLDLSTPGALAAALGERGRLALAEVEAVPAGRYARQALEATGHWPGVRDRLAQADNVRLALQFVARGEAPLGIVYATDARQDPRMREVARFDAAAHAPIVYPAARMAASGNPDAADAFLAWLRGPSARAILARHGFGEP